MLADHWGVHHGTWPLPDSLAGVMRAFAQRVGLDAGCLRVDGIGGLVLRAGGGAAATHWQDATLPVGWSAGVERRTATRSGRETPWQSLPISYASRRIGELRLHGARADSRDFCEAFARRCARLVKRQQVLRWSHERLGRPLLLAGDSEPARRLETFIEIAAASELPVLLKGEFGTEKALAAAAIHCCGPHPQAPFIEVICARAGDPPARWFEQARGGTLFFNGIDELPPALQADLLRHVPSRLHQWLTVPAGGPVRLIASTSSDLALRAAEGGFARPLLAELDFLSLTLAPLRERLGDLDALVAAAMARGGHGDDPQRARALAEICRDYAWPGNLFELERVVARLAALSAGRAVRPEDLASHVPWSAAAPDGDSAVEEAIVCAPPAPQPSDTPPDGPRAAPAADSLQRWVDCALAADPSLVQHLHPGLRKALMHLGRNYAEPISLDELAATAHVSPSHLGFLFRSIVGSSFKPLLQAVRLERAKAILRGDPYRRVTEVALSVGFMDLSHFEKSFRRAVGRTPRQFRAGD